MEKKDFKSPLWKKLEVASRGWATDCGWSVNPQKLYDFISQELDRAREEGYEKGQDYQARLDRELYGMSFEQIKSGDFKLTTK